LILQREENLLQEFTRKQTKGTSLADSSKNWRCYAK